MRKSLITCAVLGLALSGCGGGGSSSLTNSSGETLSSVGVGFALPTEISAVPTDTGSAPAGVIATGLLANIQALAAGVAVADLPVASDYAKVNTKKYVEERALEQFDIIEQVMNAVAQTNYADPANINTGPYTAMVAWVEDEDGREVKTLEPWVVESRMIVDNGQDVNRLLAWIEEPDHDNPGQTMLVKAEFKIYAAATQSADGSYNDYGVWDMNVNFGGSDQNYFAASSTIANGVNTIKIHEKGLGGGGPSGEMKGILVRSGANGHGKVSYPDRDFCWQQSVDPQNCTPPSKTAQYAYNADYMVVNADITDNAVSPVYKDRNPANSVEMTHRYGLFHADADANAGIAAGDNAERHKSFGFPLRYVDSNGITNHAYYGAWQGRHEIWGGDNLSAGDTVTREDHDPNATPVSYTVSAPFNGTLTKRTLVDGDLTDILNIPVETWLNKHWDLMWDQAANGGAGAWKSCDGWIDWGWDSVNQKDTLTCRAFTASGGSIGADIGFSIFDKFELLTGDSSGRKWVNIGRWDNNTQQPVNFVFDPNGTNGAGFYVAQEVQGQNGPQMQATNTKYTPQDGDNIWVDIGGSIYIQYTGDFTNGATGWVQKALVDFDMQKWKPEFSANGDTPFSPEVGREYYINNNGANFVVKRTASANLATDYSVKIELQSAANPVNIASILPAGTDHLATPWRPEVTFAFVTDSANVNFMKLVYASDDPNTDANDIGNVYTNGEWGLHAYNASGQPLKADGTAISVNEFGEPVNQQDGRPVQFNWEYNAQEGWGTQKFLLDANSNYVLLSDPIQLQPITATNGAGDTKTLSLQFDGWMHGLPDLYHELSKNNWQMSQELSDKVINLAEGTPVTDSNNVNYYLKPLEISVFLTEVPSNTAGVPDLSVADSVDLATVPNFTPHGMGAKPTGTVVKYSEGKPVGSGS
ncbi:MAG: hypothetical protein ACE5EH_12055 [Gammaproteobacteria bacterium]